MSDAAGSEYVPEYAPVSLHEQVQELRAQIAIHLKYSAKWIARRRMSEAYAAAQLQRLQSALRSLEALEQLLGPTTALTAAGLCQRLVVQPHPPEHA